MTSNLPASEPLSNGAPVSDSPRPRQILRPGSGGVSLNLYQIWLYRDLLWALSAREIKLRYRQTALGAVWVVLQPLLGAGVLSFVFGKVAKLGTDGIPAFPFTFAGLLVWNSFNSTLGKASSVLVTNAALISKVYFPRLCLPLSVVPPILLDLGVSLVVMAGLLVYYGIAPTIALLLFPFILLVTFAIALGFALITSALMVSYRDVQYVIPFVLNLLLYGSPIAYSVSNVPRSALVFYNLNPIVGLLRASRYALLGVGTLDWGALAYSFAFGVIVFAIGLKSFRSLERKFADVI